jgi:probable rRNA maturation factor
MKISCNIICKNRLWKKHGEINKNLMNDLAKNILMRFKNFAQVKKYEYSILLTDNSEIQYLNRAFRGLDKATNVLSFPQIEIDSREILEFKPDMHYIYIGDVAMSYQKVQMESEDYGISFHNHFVHLFAHSILHLLGFDHKDEADAEAMESLEILILKDFGISSPYL